MLDVADPFTGVPSCEVKNPLVNRSTSYRIEPITMTSNPHDQSGPKKHPLIRWRNQGGKLRAYAELRSLGGGRRALIPPGETRATTDPETAEILVHQYIAELSQRNHKKALPAIDPGPDLVDVATRHLEELAASNDYDAEWLANWEACLSRVVAYITRWQHASVHHPDPLPRRRSLASISVPEIYAFNEWLRSMPDHQGNQLSDESRRDHLGALGGVFDTAIIEGSLPMRGNPVAHLMRDLGRPSSQTRWLGIGELALLLESAKTFVCESAAGKAVLSIPCRYELVATLMLTGAQEREITRLQVHHINFEARTIDIPNPETGEIDRTIPLHSQLYDILEPYVQRLGRPSGYVFTKASGEAITGCLHMLDLIATRAGFQRWQIRPSVLTTSYIIHRLACMDNGIPIDPHKVAREVGYTSPDLVKKVFARVQYGRARMDELAYTPSAIGPDLSERLEALRSRSVELNR